MKKQTIIISILVVALHLLVIFGISFEMPQSKYNKIIAGIPMNSAETFNEPKVFNVTMSNSGGSSVTAHKGKWNRFTQPYVEIQDNKVIKRCSKEFRYSKSLEKYQTRLINCKFPHAKKKSFIKWSE